ncbi:hypothetical protein ABG79_02230 [Caloramator mitchellensis]|uniref:Flagellar Assembly Protein A N-terminal region domain-containing protein n=1 Tax=Caloramator mitchellensis TaxID=908809 RepID=A0A0R3JZM0_CALMK|nr:flagellar assembly protein A [Caloramator mitchellensis]KRQ86002.1 hypothetical protein ABG79_02230 [Caloramator mitchellensis]
MVFTGITREEAIEKANKVINIEDYEHEIKFENSLYIINILGKKTKIGIKNGEIYFEEGDFPAVLIPGKGVEVILNDEKVTKKVEVTNSDKVRIIPLKIEGKRNMNLTISEDRLTATLKVEYEPYLEYEIHDMIPQTQLIVEGKIKNEAYYKFKREEVEEILKKNNICYGIKRDALEEALNGGIFIIAEGRKPSEAIDDKIIYYFGIDKNKAIDENEKVDFFNREVFEYVEVGTILAEKVEGKDGVPGIDVHCKPIKPNKRKILNLNAGVGCQLEGNKVVASISGMPENKSNKICVFDVLSINGNIDIKTGNIKYDGNVVVKGSLTDGFKIESGNTVTIMGDVTNAEICAAGNIIINKNVISSKIKAGSAELNTEKAINYLKDAFEAYSNSINAFSELLKIGKVKPDKNIGQILKLILESKYPLKFNELSNYDYFFTKYIQGELLVAWKNLYAIFMDIRNNELTDFSRITSVLSQTKNTIDSFEISFSPADVYIIYCQNSEIFASHNVEIKGKGCYNTTITAKNDIIFHADGSVFRGGQAVANGNIKLKEVGSHAGVLTVLKTSKRGVIEANIAFQNTVLYFDEMIYKIDYPVKSLRAFYKNGELFVEKLKYEG